MVERALRYALVDDAHTALCACEDFLTDEEEFIPAVYVDRLLPERTDLSFYRHYVQCCERLGVHDVEHALWEMIVCDDIIANADRRYRNFGIIRNVETLACRLAPIFDSGSCLWVDTPLANLQRGDFSFQGKRFDPIPARQLLLVEDMSWFAPDDLDGFVEQAIQILARNPLLSERLPYIERSLEGVLPASWTFAHGADGLPAGGLRLSQLHEPVWVHGIAGDSPADPTSLVAL